MNVYNSLTREAQNTVYDFMLFLAAEQEKKNSAEKALAAMKQLSDNAQKNGTANMTMEEIDAEIALVRQERYEALAAK